MFKRFALLSNLVVQVQLWYDLFVRLNCALPPSLKLILILTDHIIFSSMAVGMGVGEELIVSRGIVMSD